MTQLESLFVRRNAYAYRDVPNKGSNDLSASCYGIQENEICPWPEIDRLPTKNRDEFRCDDWRSGRVGEAFPDWVPLARRCGRKG